jgi:hypothetical protein
MPASITFRSTENFMSRCSRTRWPADVTARRDRTVEQQHSASSLELGDAVAYRGGSDILPGGGNAEATFLSRRGEDAQGGEIKTNETHLGWDFGYEPNDSDSSPAKAPHTAKAACQPSIILCLEKACLPNGE